MSQNSYIESAHDFEVRFLECWGVLDKEIIFSTHFFNKASQKVGMKYYTLSQKKPVVIGGAEFPRCGISENDAEELEIPFNNDIFTLPKLGFINHSFFTLFYERRHKRSSPSRYRRGFRRDTININIPSIFELDTLFRDHNPIRRMGQEGLFENSAYDLFFPKFFTYEEALELVLSGKRLSAAINPSIAIKYDSKHNSIVLMKNMHNVGDYDEESNKFIMRTSLFNEDFIEIGAKIV